MKYAQLFCTVADLVADAQAPGADEARLYEVICEACDFLQKELGWFIPVQLTRKFNGRGKTSLVVPPLLSISSIKNDDDTLSSVDYLLKPDDGFWANGPYVEFIVDMDSTLLTTWIDEDDGVEISGLWGMYLRSDVTGAIVKDATGQNATQKTLLVDKGSKVSPGMVLLIGTEQEAVTGWEDPTASVTTLNGGISATEDVITVANGALINVGEVIRTGFEQMKVRDKQTHSLFVTRGWNETGRVAHLTGVAVDVYRTVSVERAVNGTTAAAHAFDTVISRYFVPDDVRFLSKQIATLILNKAKSGYQGRTGDQELGVVFYHDAFPKSDIEKVKRNYYIPKGGYQ